MSTTDRSPVRDPARTRLAVLTAFEQIVMEQGAHVSLADVAERAGVTKSGLMHHFRSRDQLIAALTAHCLERMWEEVLAQVDISESRPGQFTRGYVRALTGSSEYVTHMSSGTGLIAHLGLGPGVEHLMDLAPGDPVRWNEAFENDGLPLSRVLVIRYAADGIVASMNTPYLTDAQLLTARTELLAMTELV